MLIEQRPVCDGYDLMVQLSDGSRHVLHSAAHCPGGLSRRRR